MSKRCRYKNNNEVCQNWPKCGKLRSNMDKTLNDLKRILENEEGIVYSYVLTTVEKDAHGSFIQRGSAPNFQGGFITLCTCMHYMRTWRSVDDWKGVWIAGFTGIGTLSDHRNYLFYLMKVQKAFQSHKELWEWLPPDVKKAKSSRYSICGDVFEPKSSLKDPFNPRDYHPPTKGHVHENENKWYQDINYVNGKTGKRSALLVGDPSFSFLWTKPKLYFKNNHPRTKRWESIQDFTQLLIEK